MIKDKKIINSFHNVKRDIEELRNRVSNLEKQKKHDKNFTIWLTGLPCSGKTTIAKKLKQKIENIGYKIVHLDGDDVRQGLNSDLGFSKKDRNENLRRISHVAELFNEKSCPVIASFVSPTNDYRKMIRKIINNIILIYVNCSVRECEKRDVKGMYKKARKGEIKKFTGISAPFESPKNPEIIVDTEKQNLDESVEIILNYLYNKKYL
jgi:adenylyl-sulfate kinase